MCTAATLVCCLATGRLWGHERACDRPAHCVSCTPISCRSCCAAEDPFARTHIQKSLPSHLKLCCLRTPAFSTDCRLLLRRLSENHEHFQRGNAASQSECRGFDSLRPLQ